MPDLAKQNERLLERATSGDRRAFAAIFERYHQRLYRYCAAIVGDAEDARDALQNTMVRVLAALPGEDRELALEPWLYRIAHNEAIEILRRRRRSIDLDSIELEGTTALDARIEGRERLRQLIGDLRELPDRQRGALLMRELGGLGFEQIGEALDSSAAAARQSVYEARIGLQDMEGGRAMRCDEVRRRLSDGDRRLVRRRDVRAHLRQCARCRDFEQGISSRRDDLAAIAPLSAPLAGGILHSSLGGAAGGAGSGAGAGAAGAGAAGKAVGGSLLAKAVATGAVVVAIGAAAADRSGLIHVLPGGGAAPAPAGSSSPAAAGASATPAAGRAAGAASDRGAAGAAAAPQGRQAAPGADASPSAGGPAGAGPPSSASHRASQGRATAGTEHGTGAANAHGANPHANPHAAAGSENGRAGESGKAEARQPPPPAPSNPPPHEAPPQGGPPPQSHLLPPQGQAVSPQAPGRSAAHGADPAETSE
jgi:RNA polymerase sigma factor (sigma-70 family)